MLLNKAGMGKNKIKRRLQKKIFAQSFELERTQKNNCMIKVLKIEQNISL